MVLSDCHPRLLLSLKSQSNITVVSARDAWQPFLCLLSKDLSAAHISLELIQCVSYFSSLFIQCSVLGFIPVLTGIISTLLHELPCCVFPFIGWHFSFCAITDMLL